MQGRADASTGVRIQAEPKGCTFAPTVPRPGLIWHQDGELPGFRNHVILGAEDRAEDGGTKLSPLPRCPIPSPGERLLCLAHRGSRHSGGPVASPQGGKLPATVGAVLGETLSM